MKRYIIGIILLLATTFAAGQSTDESPYVYLRSQSKDNALGTASGAASDQSDEIKKGFAEVCPNVRIAEVQSDADYNVDLKHVEGGWSARDDRQLVLTDAWGTDLKGR